VKEGMRDRGSAKKKKIEERYFSWVLRKRACEFNELWEDKPAIHTDRQSKQRTRVQNHRKESSERKYKMGRWKRGEESTTSVI